MKKYKHKINGSIAEFVFTKSLTKDGFYSVKHKEGFTHIPIEFIENSNDWEEIKEEKKISNLNVKEEPNYLITAFKSNTDYKFIMSINEKGKDTADKRAMGVSLENMLHKGNCVDSGGYEIYSVKNSRGEEFTIGDSAFFKTTLEWQNITSKILKFDLLENFILATTEDRQGNIEYLFKDKIKTPIYTTTDGVDIYEGDRVWLSLLNKDLIPTVKDSVLIGNFCLQDKEVADRFLTFTSEENRDKYIKENSNKPIFVSADGKEMFEGYRYYVPQIDSRDKLTGTYLEFTTDTRTVSHGPKKFSTKSAAQEYIDNNKPKYSLADIEKSLNGMIISYTPINKENIINRLKKLGK